MPPPAQPPQPHAALVDPDLLTADSPAAPQPPGARVELRPHQLALLRRCERFESEAFALADEFPSVLAPPPAAAAGAAAAAAAAYAHGAAYAPPPQSKFRTRVGVLADRVGSGKSFVVLSLVLSQRAGRAIRRDGAVSSFALGMTSLEAPDPAADPARLTLLVVPHNLCAQWEQYVADFCPDDLRTRVVRRAAHLEGLQEELEELELLVVTNTHFNTVAALLRHRRVRVSRLVFDEADSLHVPRCAHVPAAFVWLVTASYTNLMFPGGRAQYDPTTRAVVWSITGIGRHNGFIRDLCYSVHGHMPMRVSRLLLVRCADGFVAASLRMRPPEVTQVLCRTPASLLVLNGVVDRAIMDCLNAGDVASALAHVSASNRSSEDNIVAVLVDKYERELANWDQRLELVRTRLQFEDEAAREAEAGRLQRKREDTARRIASIRERVASSDTCCICYDEIQNKSVAPCCSNAFCFRCINVWLARSRTCPLCKAPLAGASLLVVAPPGQAPAPAPAAAPAAPALDKLGHLEAILRRRREESGRAAKFLVFSSYDNTFAQVTALLASMDVRHSFLKGNGYVVQSIVDQYKRGDLDVLLVNPSHYGSGLNLENTTDIVLFHKFDSEAEKQVIGRADRFGRTAPLRVWYLLYSTEA